MKYYTQTKMGDQGNCFATAIGCILNRDPAEIPNFCCIADNWREATNEWLKSLGLFYMDVSLPGDLRDELTRFWGWHVISGDGPRGRRHAVVGWRGDIYHDPHPSRDGLLGMRDDWEFGLLVPRHPQLSQSQRS